MGKYRILVTKSGRGKYRYWYETFAADDKRTRIQGFSRFVWSAVFKASRRLRKHFNSNRDNGKVFYDREIEL